LVLVGHSYGGAVMSEAALGFDGVAHLVYIIGFCLEAGESFLPLRRLISSDTQMAEATRRPGGGDEVFVDPEAALDVLFGMTPRDIAIDAAARLEPQLVATFSQPVTGAPWQDVPSTYVRCSEDRAIPIAVQDAMAAHCGTVLTIDTDHSPHLSTVSEVVDLLVPLAEG
jgi:pimeloyl-ACP methyl ester carboxylesterase